MSAFTSSSIYSYLGSLSDVEKSINSRPDPFWVCFLSEPYCLKVYFDEEHIPEKVSDIGPGWSFCTYFSTSSCRLSMLPSGDFRGDACSFSVFGGIMVCLRLWTFIFFLVLLLVWTKYSIIKSARPISESDLNFKFLSSLVAESEIFCSFLVAESNENS